MKLRRLNHKGKLKAKLKALKRTVIKNHLYTIQIKLKNLNHRM